MPFRFQRRIRIAPGVRLNFSKSGIAGSVGRPGIRLGIDTKRRKYFSLGLPGTGVSYRAGLDRLKPEPLKIGYLVIALLLCMAVLAVLVIR